MQTAATPPCSTLGGIEETVFLEIGSQTRHAPRPPNMTTAPRADGKTSSVHWLRFKLTPEQIARFRTPERVVIGIGHKNYGHMAVLSEETRAAWPKTLPRA